MTIRKNCTHLTCVLIKSNDSFMKKTTFSLIFCCMAMGTFAQQPLGGFLYGTEDAPLGTEWEAPEKLSLN